MLGGAVAAMALVAWLALLNVAVVKLSGPDVPAGDRALLRVFLLLVGCFFIVRLVNPVLNQTGNALLLAGAILLDRTRMHAIQQGARENGLDPPWSASGERP